VTPSARRWHPAYVGIGSNLGNPVQHVHQAMEDIASEEGIRCVARSSLYRSAPMGPADQPDFINAVVALLTTLSARELLHRMQAIESAHGRVRGRERWGPRTLDLDLLVYGADRIDDPDLTVPHPGIVERNFVLLPLAELAPDLDVPGLGSARLLASRLDDQASALEKLDS